LKKLGEYTCEDFKRGDAVSYIPNHAHGDIQHKDVERGIVSTQNGQCVFVKYYPALTRLGWDGCTSQTTDPADLVKE